MYDESARPFDGLGLVGRIELREKELLEPSVGRAKGFRGFDGDGKGKRRTAVIVGPSSRFKILIAISTPTTTLSLSCYK